MPLISVVTPVYNVKKYIYRCIDSILAQTVSDFELILVDDGSPDNCGAVCDEYAAKDGRVRVIHQENRGQAAARNRALDMARGEYVAFVDSDDWVHPRYLEILLGNAREKKADVMLRICHDLINGELTNFLLPPHIQQIIDYMQGEANEG